MDADKGGFDDQHRKSRAVLADEDRFEALSWRCIAGHADGLALLVFVHHFGGPIGHGGVLPHQGVGLPAHHLAKRRVHIGDAALQVTGPQARDQRVFHGFAKSQRVGQVSLSLLTPAGILGQQHHHRDQGDRHAGDQGGEHIGEQVRFAPSAVHAQQQGVAWQIDQLLAGEHTPLTPLGTGNGQARPVWFDERQLVSAAKGAAQALSQQLLKAVGDDRVAQPLTILCDRQAQLHDLDAQTVALGQKIGAGISGAVEAFSPLAGLAGLVQDFVARNALKCRRTQG